MARDKYHEIVRQALIDDGWTITDDPYTLRLVGYGDVYVDIGAEKLIEAEKEGAKIAVEVKSFIGISPITNLYEALGKYDVYEAGLEDQEPDRELFLAIPEPVWYSLFEKGFVQKIIKKNNIKLVLYNIESSKIIQWIK